LKAGILGIGLWLPDTIRGNDAWPADFASRAAASAHRELTDVTAGASGDGIDRIVARYVAEEADDPFVGAKLRRVADDTMTACEGEANAARAALADANLDAREIDVVLSWALVPDRPTPPSAPRVAHLIGATRAFGIGIDVACASIIGQLLLAASLVESGRVRNVLVTSSHLMTRTFPLAHPASPNVGDAATAVVVSASENAGILAGYGLSHGDLYDAVSWRRPQGDDAPWHRAGGPMYMGSYDREGVRRVVQDTVRFGADTVAEAARRSGISPSEIDVLASVQPRRWIPWAIAESLGLSPQIAPQTFDELAHLAGCGVVANLLEARRRGLLASRSSGRLPNVCLYAQGAGFTRAALIVRYCS
jgi:3-oxoacyl-[acyl-carrier-protein] synthase-3